MIEGTDLRYEHAQLHKDVHKDPYLLLIRLKTMERFKNH